MRKEHIFLSIGILGVLLLVGVHLTEESSKREAAFVNACADYSLSRIQSTCRDLGINSFNERRPQLERDFLAYCGCLAGVWKASDMEIRAEFFAEARKPEADQSAETKQALIWTRRFATRSEYARCHNQIGINLNWIAAAQLDRKRPKPATPRPARKSR